MDEIFLHGSCPFLGLLFLLIFLTILVNFQSLMIKDMSLYNIGLFFRWAMVVFWIAIDVSLLNKDILIIVRSRE